MIELKVESFNLVKAFAYASSIEREYPISIVEQIQPGRIFVNSLEDIQTVLFWHYCGFAYLVGEINEVMLHEIHQLIAQNFAGRLSRFILQTDNQQVKEILLKQQDIEISHRFNFCLSHPERLDLSIHKGFSMQEIDEVIIEKLEGRIIPTLFWDKVTPFLEKGKGYCLIHDNEIVACAFTAAIGGGRMDIGIETKAAYRGLGLGKVVASQLAKYILAQGYEPVWACHEKNIASRKLAESIGFEVVGRHFILL